MHFNALRRQMPALLDTGVSIELISAPGRGKSEFVADTVKEMSKRDGEEWGFGKLFLATQTPNDLIGYMVPGYYELHGKRVRISEYTMPPWMLTDKGIPVTHYKRGIIFLDEYGQGEPDVKRASAELLLNGQLGPWKLPTGWSVVAASNRASDRSGVTKSYDFVINRRLQIEITDDLASWEDWAIRKQVDPLYIAFAVQNPQIVFSDGVPEKQGPWCTPRSLIMCERILKRGDGSVATDPDAVELATGMIGAAAASQLFAFIRLGQEMPKYEDIVKNPKSVKVPQKPDAQMLVCYSLAARVNEKDVDPIVTYVERFPKEFSVTFAKAACKRDFTLVNTKAFGEWCARNASLMAAIVDAK